MMSSQLGRTILGGTTSTADEMSAKPDQDGRYGPLDELLEKIVVDARSGQRWATIEGQDPNRRPGQLSADRPKPVSRPSG